MTRANRISCAGLVWHITQRCHGSAFLLKFARDRRRWVHWLFEARRRYGLSVLNYIVTCNHIHLLVRDQGCGEIEVAMQLIAGRTAQEYNLRKRRRGAFWEDRYHATAVQSGRHLCHCLVYIDLNMVRAGVVDHPRHWSESGYAESCSPPLRKARLDFSAMARTFDVDKFENVQPMRDALIQERLEHGDLRRDPVWTQSIAVGDKAYLRETKHNAGAAGRYRRIISDADKHVLKEGNASYRSIVSPKWAN